MGDPLETIMRIAIHPLSQIAITDGCYRHDINCDNCGTINYDDGAESDGVYRDCLKPVCQPCVK